MKYKAGDKVRIKSLDWYKANKDKDGRIYCGDILFIRRMSRYCGKELTIKHISICIDAYEMTEDLDCFDWNDDMIECLVESASDNHDSKMVSLDKACEWIEKNFRSDGYFSLYYVGGGIYTPKNIAKDFRKAMEE